jgi:superfamily II DNA or RNA helicase
MSNASRQDRRKQVLKQRRAELEREFALEEANYLYRQAYSAHRAGDEPGAARLLRKTLVLNPDHPGALTLLAEIHNRAGHYAEAMGYMRHLQRVNDDPALLLNIATLLFNMRRTEEAAEVAQEFLGHTRARRSEKWEQMRAAGRELLERCKSVPRSAPVAPRPAAPPTAPAPTPPEPVAPPPRAAVDFFAPALPPYSGGSLGDYLLKRRWIELRLEQNFEDLLCLPTLQGVDSYIYQQESVRRVLRHFKGRALLADEVGLGKTIEACMVLREYWLRGMVRKALVLAPPSLVSQWKGELSEKFGFQPVSPDGAEYRRDPAAFWRDQPLVVASIAMARLDPHAALVAAVPWDMVVVDEAHCLKNRASANWQLVDSLQKKFILMLTATPVENNLVELYNLITVLKPGLLATEAEFRKTYVTAGKPKSPKNPEQLRALLSEVMIRNTRAAADVSLPRRIAATVPVEPTPDEAALYEAVSHFVAPRFRQAPMAMHALQRQAGSSPHALRRSLSRALSEETWVGRDDRLELEVILERAAAIDGGSKAAQLVRMLTAHPGKAVVFSEFLPTLEHLVHLCDAHGIPAAVLTGDLSRAERDAAVARFRDHAQVLISTGSGGEGRNLQFANTVINFDLSWNPMRIEQRVGRVHRIGQNQDVFVFNFCQRGSVEEMLLRVLHDKINMFELVVGEIDAILGSIDDSRDFADIVMDLWIAGRTTGDVAGEFDGLAARLLDARRRQSEVQELDRVLFERDFEV